MRDKRVSVRGNLVRDMMQNVMETSLKQPIQSGELRKNPVEPAWICPAGYEYEIVETEQFPMEYLRPEGIFTGRVILQLHGGGYIGPHEEYLPEIRSPVFQAEFWRRCAHD